MTITLAHGHSFDSTQRELSNEYQHGRVYMVFKNLLVLVLWKKKVTLALEGLNFNFNSIPPPGQLNVCRREKDINVTKTAVSLWQLPVIKG